MDIMEAGDVLEIMAVKRRECPHRHCREPLEHSEEFQNLPEYLYCPKCHDIAYDMDGFRIARLK